MRIIFILTVTIFLFSCKHDDKGLREKLVIADSVAINYFKGNGSMDTVAAVKIIRDKNSIEQLSNFISADIITEKKSCGLDGSIHFFKNDIVIQDVYFRMYDEGCSQFTFSFNKKNSAAVLSQEAKKLLMQLKQ